MNSRYSPFVTSRDASLKSSRNSRCAGPSLSNAKPSPSCPIRCTPPAKRAPLQLGRSRARRSAAARDTTGRSGFIQNTCLMSVTSSSWCCCSWCSPSSMSACAGCCGSSSHALQQIAHRVVHVRAILEHLAHRGPRDEPALRATVTLARLHVVRVEQERVPRIRRDVLGRVRRRVRTSRRTSSCARGATWSGSRRPCC